jgi:hypothetical protein
VRPPTTAAEREERDQRRQEKLKRLHVQLTDRVAAVVDSDALQPPIATQARMTPQP